MAYTKSNRSTLVTPERAKILDKKRRAAGHIMGAPTKAWAARLHESMKSRYSFRDEMLRLFVSMVRLESPFVGDKASISSSDVAADKAGRVRHTTAPMPFDAYTLGLSLTSDKHPYTTVHPMGKKHNDDVMDKYDRFTQAVLDMRMVKGDVLTDAAVQSIVTGWLPTLHYFDPVLMDQGRFPFDYQVLSPLNVYPLLNHMKQPIVCTIEYQLTGAQLAEDFHMYQGVADLIEAEGEEDDNDSNESDDDCFFNSTFKVIRYYDDTYTMLLIDPVEVGDLAIQRNHRLRQLKNDKEKGRYHSLLGSLSEGEDPYAGVEEHNLGGMPVHLEGCWPDPLPPHAFDSRANVTTAGMPGYNSIVYYPFLYSMRPAWIDLSRLRSMQQTLVQRATKPEIVAKTDNPEKFLSMAQRGIYLLEPDQNEDVKYLQKPDPIDESFKFTINEIKEDLDRGSYGKAVYGSRAGQGGRQQEMNEEAGSVRQDMLTRMMQRSLAAYPMGVTETLMHREIAGEEDVFVAGLGDKFGDGSGYTLNYSVKELGGVCPLVTVELLRQQKFKEVQDVATLQVLKGTDMFSDEDLLRFSGVVNPKRYIQNAKKEALEKVKDVFQVDVDLAVAEKKNETVKALWKANKKYELTDDELKNEAQKELIKQKVKELPIEKQIADYQATLQELQQKAQQAHSPEPAQTPPPNPGMLGLGAQPGAAPSGPPLPPPGAPGPGAGGPPPNVMVAPGIHPGAGPMPMRPPMPMQGPMPMRGPTPGMPGPAGPGGPGGPPLVGPMRLAPGMAKGPGQAQQPFQAPSRFSPPGGIGRPGMPSVLSPGQGLPGTPVTLPKPMQDMNKAVQLPQIQKPTLGNVKKHKRGKRG